MFRVSFGERFQGVLDNVELTNDSLVTLQDQISSGKRLRKPEDDPAAIGTDLGLRATQADDDQYVTNLNDAKSFLNASEAGLNDLMSTLQRARELAVEAANGTLNAQDTAAIGTEVHQLLLHAVGVGNSSFENRYLYSGVATTTAPFTLSATTDRVTYDGTTPSGTLTGAIVTEVAPGVTLAMNVVGSQGFPAVYAALSDLDTDLRTLSGSQLTQSVGGTRLGELDVAIQQVTGLLTDVGARQNRVSNLLTQTQSAQLATTEQLSSTEDLDMAKAITEFSMSQTVYQAALATGAKITQTTLMDFLK
jgi:flagellar hook-associated protein 3 FlgL